ncbi:MAG: prepilin-type N-terminal cleavage/methylation domain-containing protein [Flavobacteriales bacterium]|nr:prepilin-type N-terminal cleavage/methylation domain-containing protein [Flavobacteriales bacterium]
MKIKAFTITELTIALAISAIVTTIGYHSIEIVSKVLRLRNENLNYIEQTQELRFLLKHDFSRYHDWSSKSRGVIRSNRGGIQYRFTEKEITRSEMNQELVFQFDSVLVQQQINEQSFVLNSILLEITKNKQKHYIRPRINIEASFFINQTKSPLFKR